MLCKSVAEAAVTSTNQNTALGATTCNCYCSACTNTRLIQLYLHPTIKSAYRTMRLEGRASLDTQALDIRIWRPKQWGHKLWVFQLNKTQGYAPRAVLVWSKSPDPP